MSRLIVKNIPTYITEKRLREHFSAQGGEITDVRLIHKADGTSRRVAFLGFKHEKDARTARDYFDQTYLDISKLRVDLATGTKDAPLALPNKRPREKQDSALEGEPKCKKVKLADRQQTPDGRNSSKEDRLREFTRIMSKKHSKKTDWGADVEMDVDDSNPTSRPKEESEAKGQNSSGANSADSDGRNTQGNDEGTISDAEWMRRRMGGGELDQKAFEQSDDEDELTKPEIIQAQPAEMQKRPPTHEAIRSTSRLFVRNLVFSCTEEELRRHFEEYGLVDQVHLVADKEGNSKGFAYVRYHNPEHAVAAFDAMDGSSFQGRLLHILPAVDRQGQKKADDADPKKRTLKGERAQKRKETSGKDFNWAVLYMNSDAVASSIASRLNVSKSDILSPESSTTSPAVKLALAETHVIVETKKFLEEQGVDLEAFTRPRAVRSQTAILVKNIPYGTSVDEVREVFGSHGRLTRLLMPPAGTIAIVEFADARDAGKAYTSLAYKRMKDSIMYLEKAPEGLFDGAPAIKRKEDPETPASATAESKSSESGNAVVPGSTIHLGNLSFGTTTDRLKSVFHHLPGFLYARVATKVDPNKPGVLLSQGFGFVGFKDAEGAAKAIKGMRGFVLDGHVLKVNFAGRGQETEAETSVKAGEEKGKERKKTKMVVKNLPFEANKKELWELFRAHGQVKSIRLPSRADRRSRGFAFVEFTTHQEALGVQEALRHTHLLGRHLILDWAEEEGDVEARRAKTKIGFGTGKGLPGQREKLRLGDGGGAEEELIEA